MTELPSMEQRMECLLRLAAEKIRPCEACPAQLYFIRHRNGELAPYTVEGLNHFRDCPGRDRFKRKTQPGLFEEGSGQ